MNPENKDISSVLRGESPGMRQLREELHSLAGTDAPVIIYGETGTGKELVARCLHSLSDRREKTFVPVNCGGIPEALFESELFGHEQGAFTGALKARVGLIEHARGGSLLLDEIESMPLGLQVKVLRFLQEGVLRRLGANNLRDIDVRILATSKEDLLQAGREGRFRDDLYYRLGVAEVHLPPLRERQEDILPLFEHFYSQRARAVGRSPVVLSSPAIEVLLAHSWRGNIRELRNVAHGYALGLLGSPNTVLRRLTLASAQDTARVGPGTTPLETGSRLKRQVNNFERQLIAQCLQRHEGNVRAVLEELGIPRRTLNDKMGKYGLRPVQFRKRK